MLQSDANTIDDKTYHIAVAPLGQRLRAYAGAVCVLDSNNVLVMRETHLTPVYYVPQDDIDMSLFESSDFQTFCPFKGNSTHWNLKVDGKLYEKAAWSYQHPLPEARSVSGYLAFYGTGIDRWLIGAEEQEFEGPKLQFKEPKNLIEWLVRGAWSAENSAELTNQLGLRLLETGIPVSRVNVAIRQLHPLLAGEGYVWNKNNSTTETFQFSHEALDTDQYQKSPMKLVSEGLGGIRQRLNAGKMVFDFPILDDLKEQGATDYVAMPLHFSDGKIHNLSLTSDHPDGFTTGHLGQIFEALPIISRMYELHLLKSNSQTLLQTYLGTSAGNKVLMGSTKRGDGETIHAVITYIDLVGSTQRTEQLGQKKYLKLLDEFFECAGTPVIDNGGDILKFMGDGILSIFPIQENSDSSVKQACQNAVQAARQTIASLDKLEFSPKIACTIGVHIGEVMYGNVGSPQRLDFTVIGSAANEVARIGDSCKNADEAMLISEGVAKYIDFSTHSKGVFNLKGVSKGMELYALDDSKT